MQTNEQKLADFFSLLAQRQQEHEAEKERERKEKEDAKLARLKPWYLQASQ
jgi:hypothetical protein